MIFDMLFTEQTLMIFVIAVVFTAVGWFWGTKTNVTNITAAVIDSLIEDGYLKTRGTGSDMEIIKHKDWCNKDVDV